MNPQMQQYRHGAYPQGQPRGAPAARRPGECDSSTNLSLPHGFTIPSQQHHGSRHTVTSVAPSSNSSQNPSMLPNATHTHARSHAIPQVYHQTNNQLLHPIFRAQPQFQAITQRSSHLNSQRINQSMRPVAQQTSNMRSLPHTNYSPGMYMPMNTNLHMWRTGGPVPPNAAYPHPNAAAAAAQHAQQMQTATAQQRHALLEHQSAQRRARKPTDKTLPDGIDELLVAPSLAQQYRDLRDSERRLDYTMMRKRTDLQDTFNRTVKRQKTMRVWITNTAENQPWQGGGLDENAFDFNSGNDPTFRVKIEGKLLDEPEDDIFASDDEADPENKEEKKTTQKFTSFFKSLTVEFDRARQGGMDTNMQVEWKKQANFSDVDEMTFSRRGDENMNITVNLVRDENPERYRLSHALAQTLDMEEADRAETVMGLWEYVKVMGLQEEEEKRSIRCDDSLRQIFGREQVYFPQIPELIMPHLHPLPPIKLPYTIRVDQAYLTNPEPTVYDIRVSVDDPIRAKVMAMVQNPEHMNQLRQILRLDDELAVVIQTIQHSKAKHTFYKQMSRDPVNFINKWMASQRQDLEIILGEAARGGGEDGMGPEFARGGDDGVWGSDLTREAVRYLLAKNVVVKG